MFDIFKDHRPLSPHIFNPSGIMFVRRGLHRSLLFRSSRLVSPPYCVRRFHFAIHEQYAISPPFFRFALPALTSIVPIIAGMWDSILRAVPKKKTTHSRKRKRQLVGKALEDKKNLTRCEACGDLKLLHTLCASCVKSIQKDWRKRERLEGL